MPRTQLPSIDFSSWKKPSDVSICTLGSHTALQILKGARDEGFRTRLVSIKAHAPMYRHFGLADELIELPEYKDFFSVEAKLLETPTIMIPHGTFTSRLSAEDNKRMCVPYYGNKEILDVESDRNRQRDWLALAGLNLPEHLEGPADIDRPTIVKYFGAQGGKGYFMAKNEREFEAGIARFGNQPHVIQEYIIGVPLFIHYFYSPLTDELEIMSIDRRYETNVDSLGRIPLKNQEGVHIDPSFVVVGNSPLVLRESLLAEAFTMGRKVVEAAKKVCPPRGFWGPFCLETIITPESKFFVIEISARIVAGTNLFIEGSPYTWLKYDVPMSTGRRIAREFKSAMKLQRLEELLS